MGTSATNVKKFGHIVKMCRSNRQRELNEVNAIDDKQENLKL